VNPDTFDFSGTLSVGSLADSFYEYLFKLYLLSDRQDLMALQLYNDAMEGLEKHLLVQVEEQSKHFAFIGEKSGGALEGYPSNTESKPQQVMEHLTCFVPGLLAISAKVGLEESKAEVETIPEQLQRLQRGATHHEDLSHALLRSCVMTYFQASTGLGPEAFRFPEQVIPVLDATSRLSEEDTELLHNSSLGLHSVDKSKYILRPETIESLYVLYRSTGDQIYRDWAWEIFQSIETFCKTPSAYTGLLNVNVQNPVESREDNWNDSMQSFYLAETLKYLYLLFHPTDLLPFEEFVFNTEAHPLRIIPAADYAALSVP
jgi:mannosyl-oligosaccharide alpha-1,2-mannosidase